MSDQVRVNGNMHSWGSLILKVGGERFYGFKSIEYADKRERVKAYGMNRSQAPRGRSRGKYTVEPVKIAGPVGTAQALRKFLAEFSRDGKSYGDVEFNIVVQYVDTGEDAISVEIEDCVWSENNASHEEGPDDMQESIVFDAMRIRRNGLVLFDATNEGR